MVLPKLHRGKPEMCKIHRTQVRSDFQCSLRHKLTESIVLQRPGQPDLIYFSYQRDKYMYNHSTSTFGRVSYPCDGAPALSTLQASKGLTTATAIEQARTDYGKNEFDIPVPTFGELFAEHAVAPFFVFQLFCTALWLFDDYWYYSLFTLFMLVVFECVTIFQVRSACSAVLVAFS